MRRPQGRRTVFSSGELESSQARSQAQVQRAKWVPVTEAKTSRRGTVAVPAAVADVDARACPFDNAPMNPRVAWLAPVLFAFNGISQTVPVSESMSLNEIARAMEAYPPRWEFGDQRAAIMASLDRHVSVQIRKGWT